MSICYNWDNVNLTVIADILIILSRFIGKIFEEDQKDHSDPQIHADEESLIQ